MVEKQNTQNWVGSKFESRKLSPPSSSILLRCVTKFKRLLSPPPRPRAPIQEKKQNTQNRVGSLVGLSRQTRTVSSFWAGLLRFVENPPPPSAVINHLQALKSSEESLREQLEEAKKKEAAFIVTLAKREQEIAELKVMLQAKLDEKEQEIQTLQYELQRKGSIAIMEHYLSMAGRNHGPTWV